MIAFTFPGQGSQRPGTGRPWAEHPSWELVAEASEAAGRDVAHLLLHADAEDLKETRNAQLSTYVASLVVLDAVERLGVAPAHTAGHSLGEYTALTAAGALAFDDGVRLVSERGEAMQAAAEEHEGTMAAVLGLDDETVDIACARAEGDVWLANCNAPGQAVIAGSPDGVAAASDVAKELGAKKVLPVAVSGAFHTPHMAPARDRLRKALAETDLRDPTTPIVANVDARRHDRASEWSALLLAQLTSPVRWRQSVATLVDEGVTTFVEIGPGTVLTGLAKRAARGARALSVSEPSDLDALLETIAGAPATEAVDAPSGEHLFVAERLVVSPAAGLFQRGQGPEPGIELAVGDPVGRVAGQDIRSAFAGQLMGYLALEGERIVASQPIAWLKAP